MSKMVKTSKTSKTVKSEKPFSGQIDIEPKIQYNNMQWRSHRKIVQEFEPKVKYHEF